MSDDDRLDRAIAIFKAHSEIAITRDSIAYQDLINWLEELKERREEPNTEYDLNLLRRQWEED